MPTQGAPDWDQLLQQSEELAARVGRFLLEIHNHERDQLTLCSL